ncbi:uncharacterized protein [Choristoneura fumiferana]|uniref:uncharacterized protein n=1 Tax=Choristoneura fumiferana TaxID=7141 RepID=UPI003D157162
MMESEDEEESCNAILSGNLTREEISQIILGPETEWENKDMERGESGRKRGREEASSESDEMLLTQGFTLVHGRNKKRDQRDSPHRDYEVSISSKEALPKKIGMAKLLKDENITGIIKVVYRSPYKLLIRFKDNESAGTLVNCTQITSRGWSCRKTNELTYVYGVVRDVDLEIEDEKIKDELQCGIEIIDVKRLNKRDKEGKWTKSEKVRLRFKGSDLPTYVYSYGIRMEVEPYIFPVTQCSRCWKFGHIKNFCPSNKPICPKCGADHENCEASVFKCVNCKGNHMSVVKSLCPAFHREKKVREVMAEYKCTYKRALLKIREGSPTPEKFDDREEFEDRPQHEETLENPTPQSATTLYVDVLKRGNFNTNKNIKINKPKATGKGENNRTKKNVSQEKLAGKNPMENNDREEKEESETGPQNQQNSKKDKQGFGIFRRFIAKMKEILMSRDGWEEKLHKVVRYIAEEIKLLLKECWNFDTLLNILSFSCDGQTK